MPPRLKTPRDQAPRDDLEPQPAAPGVTVIEDPAELMYQAYVKALDYKGPGGKGRAKMWHELSVHDRKAFRTAFQEMRLLLASGNQVMAPTPGRDEVTLIVAGNTAYNYRKTARSEIKSVAVLRSILGQMDARVAQMEGELHHEPKKTMTGTPGNQFPGSSTAVNTNG
jgi:hypothetical protein